MKSILQTEKSCLVCKTTYDIHTHHVFCGSSNRKNSEKYGLTVYLCGRHHNMSNNGVHFNKELDNKIKRFAQEEFEKKHTREEFRAIFGKSWL